jgi:hypothetical protein
MMTPAIQDACPTLRIKHAEEICKRLGLDGVIILAFPDLMKYEFKGVSYGKDRAKCKMLGRIMDKCMKFLANPDNWKAPEKPKWLRDDECMQEIFLAVFSVDVSREVIATWSDAECQAVEKWCGAYSASASDNIVRIPPKPAVLAGIEELPA